MSKKKLLVENDQISEEAFMPEEFDDAFVGKGISVFFDGIPVYSLEKIGDRQFPDTPDGMIEPMFIENFVERDTDIYFENFDDLCDAIVGYEPSQGRVVYEYDKLLEAYTMLYLREEYNNDDDTSYKLFGGKLDGESFEEFQERNMEEAYSEAGQQIDTNTLRDYMRDSHTGELLPTPIVIMNLDFML